MNIITVYPIIRGAFKDELTYWSSHSFNLGSIIEVPLRGRNIPALVGSVTPASHAKANIKQASFVTRKIEKIKELCIVHPESIRACIHISEQYAVPLGSVIKACIPDFILQEAINENEDRTDRANKSSKSEKADKNEKNKSANGAVQKSGIKPDHKKQAGIASDILVFQTNTEDRLGTYKSIVREEFARKRSVLIIAPTVISAEELHQNLQKGIEDFVVVLHGSLSKKKQSELWEKVISSEHPILIIATPLFSSIPRNDIQTIILERESSRAYSAIRPPHIDYRDYIESYAKFLSARLIYGDTLLRMETLYRREVGELSDFFPVSYRVEKDAELIIVDMSSSPKINKAQVASSHTIINSSTNFSETNSLNTPEPSQTTKNTSQNARLNATQSKKPFQIFSEELHSMIEYTGKKELPMFIFTARRGLSPQTVCGDCGHTVECEVCKAPIVLHQKKSMPMKSSSDAHHNYSSNANNKRSGHELHQDSEGDQSYISQSSSQALGINPNRFFLCHHCGTERAAIEACITCGSWKLITLGVGIETVAEEIKKHFPKREIYRLDKDTVKTDKQAQAVIGEFKKSKDGILLGTESSLAFLPEIEYSAIASLDSLFSIPDFKINERIAHTILRILEKTRKYVLIQTRNAKNPVLKYIESGNLLSLYREEIAVRKMLNYPPFITHIKITVEDTKSGVADKMKKLQYLLEQYEKQTKTELQSLVFPAFVPGSKGKSILHLLLSIPKGSWPNEHLRSLLMSLPKEYAVRVNPESLL